MTCGKTVITLLLSTFASSASQRERGQDNEVEGRAKYLASMAAKGREGEYRKGWSNRALRLWEELDGTTVGRGKAIITETSFNEDTTAVCSFRRSADEVASGRVECAKEYASTRDAGAYSLKKVGIDKDLRWGCANASRLASVVGCARTVFIGEEETPISSVYTWHIYKNLHKSRTVPIVVLSWYSRHAVVCAGDTILVLAVRACRSRVTPSGG